MKKTISEKAVDAINELNKSALLMARQMKSGELDKTLGDKAYLSAHRKVKTWRKSQYADFGEWKQLDEFNCSDLEQELETANERYCKVLKHYAKAVGVEFLE
jgi:hypothetical protein